MLNPLGNDDTFAFLKVAMDTASVRQQVIASNIANVDTPGYKARDLNFEQVMSDYSDRVVFSSEQARGKGLSPAPLLNFDDYIIEENDQFLTQRVDGNNVDIDKEMGKLAAAGGSFTRAAQFASRKIRLVNEALR